MHAQPAMFPRMMFPQTTAYPGKFSVFCDDFANFVKYVIFIVF